MDSLPKSFNPNKRLKEEFVSNLSGSSIFEIAALLTNVSLLILLRHSFSPDRLLYASLKKSYNEIVRSKDWTAYMATMAVDFLVIVVPVVFFLTMIGTCLCILAVDFKIFPRKYAKTETYGTSLMDLGVGSFVLVNSLVSRQARNVSAMNWRTALQSTSPLIILGFVRLVSTAGVDYQVHVGEYGVHWNFFFTLAAISILTSTINVPTQYSGILGSLVLVGYQICLMHGLNLYLLSNKRGIDIISQNKEGIFSLFGYWGMYLLGVQLGNYLFFGKNSSAMLRSNGWARIRVWVLAPVLDNNSAS